MYSYKSAEKLHSPRLQRTSWFIQAELNMIDSYYLTANKTRPHVDKRNQMQQSEEAWKCKFQDFIFLCVNN